MQWLSKSAGTKDCNYIRFAIHEFSGKSTSCCNCNTHWFWAWPNCNCHSQKNPRVRKIFVRNSGAGNGCVNFMDAWKNALFLQEKPMSIKFLVWGGGEFGFGGGGGSADFISMGAEILLRFCRLWQFLALAVLFKGIYDLKSCRNEELAQGIQHRCSNFEAYASKHLGRRASGFCSRKEAKCWQQTPSGKHLRGRMDMLFHIAQYFHRCKFLRSRFHWAFHHCPTAPMGAEQHPNLLHISHCCPTYQLHIPLEWDHASPLQRNVALPALQKNFVNIFFVFAWEFCIEKWRGFLVNFFWSPSHMKRSTKSPRKIRGKFGAKFGAKSGTKIPKIRETFVLQLFWPKEMPGKLPKFQGLPWQPISSSAKWWFSLLMIWGFWGPGVQISWQSSVRPKTLLRCSLKW